ncbi:TPA: DUF3012 domain-containing protein [Vibrio vulnificus]|uniref:DUF3012 domain-containing protein n=1 Tax=Vibrio vulnificus TaxID=672 RepID=UPI0002DB55F4|nr:DUF3012 domain-containing protein [Vibrio vulnificus]ASM98715.1 hypothetical protein AOT11_04495 [Vibrio vulnificus NBRC 15645 = ATCC 27562]EHV9836365.1 DUF3012 domain-containing protein [Vibrio vulnificus]MCL7016908.1 DUF3012 domain-containing protein [Vibrio vulnificus]MCU8191498.1 DUF3012 domain-containing protein [Vibrio vulnificus]MCU8234875.1 DUF3012 domain-containing protein [Vibrio vulnificus]
MRTTLLALLSVLTLSACSEVGSESWCNNMRDKPKSEWNGQNTLDFAKHCLLNNEIGSKSWCEDMDEKSKGDWTAKEATSYAKYCVL